MRRRLRFPVPSKRRNIIIAFVAVFMFGAIAGGATVFVANKVIDQHSTQELKSIAIDRALGTLALHQYRFHRNFDAFDESSYWFHYMRDGAQVAIDEDKKVAIVRFPHIPSEWHAHENLHKENQTVHVFISLEDNWFSSFALFYEDKDRPLKELLEHIKEVRGNE